MYGSSELQKTTPVAIGDPAVEAARSVLSGTVIDSQDKRE
jgi:hypothetical protein